MILKNTYYVSVSETQKLMYDLIRSYKMVKFQWIPSNIIPGNDAVDLH